MSIDFSGPAAALPQVPAWQVLQQAEGFWRDRTVLIGATAPELGDQQETPFGSQSGAQVQLAALATVMEGRSFQPLPSPLVWLLLGGWTLLVAGMLSRSRQVGTTVAVTVGIAAAGLLGAGGIWALAHRLPPVSVLVAMPLLGGRPALLEPVAPGEPGARLSAPGAFAARLPHPAARHPAGAGADLDPGGGGCGAAAWCSSPT